MSDIERQELDEEVMTIPGTRRMHQFQALKEFVLQARSLAGFCTACRRGTPYQCLNKEYVGDYVVHKCKQR